MKVAMKAAIAAEPASPSTPLPPPLTLAWLVWGIGAALYFIGFYQRVAPAVITTELSTAFTLTAAGLGNLSAFYFYSYVAMQIPTGLLADRFGPRILLTVGAAIAAVGTATFAMANDVITANIGRLLIGGSVGVTFVSMLKVASHWMPARQFALASSYALAVGVFGAVFAGAPLRILVDAWGWRDVMWASAALTLVVAAIAWWLVRDDPTERGFASFATKHEADSATATKESVWRGLRVVLGYRNVVLLYFLAGSMTGIVLTFAGLWGVPFLMTHFDVSQTRAATMCSAMMVWWALGSVAFGVLSDRLKRRKLPLFYGIAFAALLWAWLIFERNWSNAQLAILLSAIGFCAGSFIIVFAFAKESVPLRYAGTVSGVANMGVIQGPMLMQPLVGVVLDRSWSASSGALLNGKRLFEWAAYSQAFTMILAWAVLSLVLLAFMRETHCRQTV
jgi:sugar phosphate permease